jgi:Uma2 family endonuclease
MKTRKPPRPARAPSAARVRKPAAVAADRMVLHNVSWQQYEQMTELFAENRVFMTYADGQLEIRMPSREHERAAQLLDYIIAFVAMHLEIRMEPLGSTTFKASGVEKGLEPDKCFYLTNIAQMLEKEKLDLSIDPPPDLAVEIEITRSLVPRLPIYQQLRIPELWRYDGKSVTIELLEDEDYVPSPRSKAFGKLTPNLIERWMKLGQAKGYSVMLQAVQAWCRKQK